MKLPSIFTKAAQWVSETPERTLDQAYKSALKIKDIETKYFQGNKVSEEFSPYGDSLTNSLKSEVNGYLQGIKMRLAVFKTSRFFLNLSHPDNDDLNIHNSHHYSQELTPIDNGILPLEKFQFIDEVVAKYQEEETNHHSSSPSEPSDVTSLVQNEPKKREMAKKNQPRRSVQPDPDQNRRLETASQKSGALPRSFLRTINRIKQEIDPKSGDSEEEVINKYRISRYKTAISIKFILFLVIVPLLTHQLTKTFFITPLVNQYFQHHEMAIFLNQDLEEEAFLELQHYEEHLKFQGLLGLREPLTPEEIEEEVKHEAVEISEKYRRLGTNAIANVFADIFSLGAFATVIAMSRREIEIVKAFLDEILYSLSDSAKAFLIILFTDMFVGFHSPHGWEVILEGISHHFGLPENREFNFLFIATFPVILDTVLKYWIFRYLNRISPSAVATYKNMNE